MAIGGRDNSIKGGKQFGKFNLSKKNNNKIKYTPDSKKLGRWVKRKKKNNAISNTIK